MAAYQVAIVKITNPTLPGFKEYVKKAAELTAKAGATYVVRGPADEVPEGEVLKGVSVIVTKWPSLDAAKAFYHSAEYQAIVPLRDGSGVYDLGIFPEAPV